MQKKVIFMVEEEQHKILRETADRIGLGIAPFCRMVALEKCLKSGGQEEDATAT